MIQAWATKLSSKVILALVAVIGVLLFGWYEHGVGYEAAKALWSAKYGKLVSDTKATSDREAKRQAEANLKARLELSNRIAELNTVVSTREATIKELQSEAASDPDADRVSVSVSGVRRINRAGGR